MPTVPSPFPTPEQDVRFRGMHGVRRVAVIGAGAVGSAFAFALVQRGDVGELVLIDKDERLAEGQIMDLSHCLPYGQPMKLSVGDLDSANSCDLVVVTAGVAQTPGESRIDLVKRNAEIFSTFFPRLWAANPGGIFLIVTNPVDVMTRLALKFSGGSPDQIFGTGTVLDTARFRQLTSEHLGIDSRNVHGYVIGEHGDSEVVVWSRSTVGPYGLLEYGEMVQRPFDTAVRAQITHSVKRAAYQIIERKGATNFAIGVCLQRIFESIDRNSMRLLTVSRALSGAYGYQELCLSIPCLVGRHGASAPTPLNMDAEEMSAFLKSAETIDAIYHQLGA